MRRKPAKNVWGQLQGAREMRHGFARQTRGTRCQGQMLLLSLALFCICGCKRDDMADQARYKPLAASTFYADGSSARMPVPHTIDQAGEEAEDWETWKTARSAGSGAHWNQITGATQFPFAITEADLNRGQQVFAIDCTPCHGILGDGDGMVPERGFTRPPSYHSDRLRQAPPAYFFDVITNGIGAMFPYADRVATDDRWCLAAYIKALQLSQDATVADLPQQDRQALAATHPATPNTSRATP